MSLQRLFAFFMGAFLFFQLTSFSAYSRNLVLLTDWEPDDKIGIHVLSYYLVNDKLGLVGTTLMNSERKKILTNRTLQDLGHLEVPVLRGTGGTKDSYPDIASSLQARTYAKEGQGILSAKELASLELAPRDGQPFQEAFEKYLRTNENVEVVIMSAPTDIIEVLERHPELISKIKTLHVMGGWVIDKEGNLRSTFNWNMGHLATARLLALSGKVRIRLYSSHMIKKVFNNGSISRKNMPALMATIEFARANLRGLQDLEIASRLWDEEIIEKIPKLKEVIGVENIGKQFTPADVALVMSLFSEKHLEVKTIFSGVSLDIRDLDSATGFKIQLDPNFRFPIEVVEELDIKFFESEMKTIFANLPHVVENRFREYRLNQKRLNEMEIEESIKKQNSIPVSILSLGQNISYIQEKLATLDPEKYFFIVDATKEYALEFARMARRLKFKVIGLSPNSELSRVEGFSQYDDFLVTNNRADLTRTLKLKGRIRLNLYRPIGEEIYISFHTKDQSLAKIELSLAALARKHPNATLVHGFLPRSQIHYLPEQIQPVVIQTLHLIDKYFPNQLRMRNSYVGLGDTRLEMAARAARNRSAVYTIGSVTGGVADEVLMYLKKGTLPLSIELGETDIQRVSKISYASECLRPLREIAR